MRGLFLEGAKWSKSEHSLAESDPKVLFSLAPVILFRPVKKSEMSVQHTYACPVYKTRCVSCRGGGSGWWKLLASSANDVFKT